MKKICILLVSCLFWLCSSGQGTAYIKKSNVQGYSQIIRQWKTCPWAWGTGVHAVYYTDAVLNVKGFVGVTDIYNNFKYTQITDNLTIRDMEVLDDMAYLCGHTSTGHAFIGWIDLSTLSGSTNIFEMNANIGTSVWMSSLENIVAYYDAYGNPCVTGYGITPSGYYGVEYNMSTNQAILGVLPYTPHDVTVTNNYVVYTGTLSGSDIVIHPIPKTGTFIYPYLPFYLYQVGSTTVSEPFARLHITNTGGDGVATISYRLEGSEYGLILREFDLSGAFSIYDVPMQSSTLVKLNYSATAIFDFRYDSISKRFAVFHNYEVTPSFYHDAVTKMDYSNGVPSSVQSDYLAITNQTMASMSLSDSSMYVVYGYDTISKENVFWKESLPTSVTGTCLYSDVLNVISVLHLIEGSRHDAHYGNIPDFPNIPSTINCRGSGDIIAPVCH